MPFVSIKDKRQRDQNLTPYEPALKEPDFYDVYSSAVGQVIDEELSISSYLNMGSFNERKDKVKSLVDDGLDIDLYTNQVGVIDYDRIARDTGKIESDEALFQKRNDLLANRRKYSQDVLDRGNGMAQFFGMATGFMLDPINIATLPIATTGVSLKSLGVLGAAMTVAKREAALATASELGIQSLVYQHKHDIDSPYSTKEALANIAIAATGAAVLGGAAGGLAGYFGKVRKAAKDSGAVNQDLPEKMADEQLARVSNSPEEMAYEQLARMEETLSYIRTNDTFHDLADDYAKVMQGDIDNFVTAKQSTIDRLEKEIVNLEKSERVSQVIANAGGLNMEEWSRQGFSKQDVASLKGVFGKPLFRKSGGMTADDLAELLHERGIIRNLDANSALDYMDNMFRSGNGKNDFVDEDIARRYQSAIDEIDRLENADDDVLELIYRDAAEMSIKSDVEMLADYEARMESYDQPSKASINYNQPQPQKAAPSTVTARERDVLQRTGEVENYDADIQAFDNLYEAGRIDNVQPERGRNRTGRDQQPSAADTADTIASRKPLEGAPIKEGATGPDAGINAAAERYARANGIELARQSKYVDVDESRASRLAQAFEDMIDNPSDPIVQEAYRDLVDQTRKQYDALIEDGYEFTFYDSKTDPYNGNPYNAMRDLRNNKRMASYGTYDGSGTLADFKADLKDPNRILLQDSGLRWKDQNGKKQIVTNNDLFRAVHDAFGHSMEGAGFRARGEENAFQAHAKLFRGPALRALTTETRGQNSWLNYGPYGEKNRTASVLDTVFADQKMGLMPEWTSREGVLDDSVNVIPERNEVLVAAKAEMEAIEDEIMGINSVLECAIG